jgi:hypothetical protein
MDERIRPRLQAFAPLLTKYGDITILELIVTAEPSPNYTTTHERACPDGASHQQNFMPALKPVIWVGSSRKDLRAFPEPVQDHMGYSLYVAQCGGKHRDTKTLSGFGGSRGSGSSKGLSRRYVSRRVHLAVCGSGVCPSRFPEEIEDWT